VTLAILFHAASHIETCHHWLNADNASPISFHQWYWMIVVSSSSSFSTEIMRSYSLNSRLRGSYETYHRLSTCTKWYCLFMHYITSEETGCSDKSPKWPGDQGAKPYSVPTQLWSHSNVASLVLDKQGHVSRSQSLGTDLLFLVWYYYVHCTMHICCQCVHLLTSLSLEQAFVDVV